MDQNSTNYGGSPSNTRDSTLGAGSDSFSVTGTGADQDAAGGLTPSSAGSQSMGGSYGSSSAGLAGQGLGEQSYGGAQGGQSVGERASQAKDAAADKLAQARDAAGDKLGQAKEKATELKATLADKLDQGAQSLRNQGGSQQFAGANGATLDANSGMNKYAAPAATAMERTAEFLRGEGDLKGVVEEQVRVNPGRTLLIAVGLGYLLGKAIRR